MLGLSTRAQLEESVSPWKESSFKNGDDHKKIDRTWQQDDGVYPIKAKVVGYESSESIKTFYIRLHWRRRGIIYQHDPRHGDVLVKDFGLEHGNSVQTPVTMMQQKKRSQSR